MQKFLRINGEKTDELNEYLIDGWIVKEFQSFSNRSEKGNSASYAYVLIEKN